MSRLPSASLCRVYESKRPLQGHAPADGSGSLAPNAVKSAAMTMIEANILHAAPVSSFACACHVGNRQFLDFERSQRQSWPFMAPIDLHSMLEHPGMALVRSDHMPLTGCCCRRLPSLLRRRRCTPGTITITLAPNHMHTTPESGYSRTQLRVWTKIFSDRCSSGARAAAAARARPASCWTLLWALVRTSLRQRISGARLRQSPVGQS